MELDDQEKILERKIIEMFLNGSSIRNIVDTLKEKNIYYGRTKINNIIEKYADICEENAVKVALIKYNNKNHTSYESLDSISSETISDKQIEQAYKDIIEGAKTLTSVSQDLKRNRETVKKMLEGYIGDDKDALAELESVLKKNQNGTRKSQYFDKATFDEKKKMIFDRLNSIRADKNRTKYSEKMLNKKFNRLLFYFRKRNEKIDNPDYQISEKDLLKMMYNCPTMLSMSLTNKIKPVIGKMDHTYFGYNNTSKILKENPSILATAMTRIHLQVKILNDERMLNYAIQKPCVFRTSPELMYSLIQAHNEYVKLSSPFMSSQRVSEVYGISSDKLKNQYDIMESKYKDDEYFDER